MTPALAILGTDRLVHLSGVDLVIVAFSFALVLGIGFYLKRFANVLAMHAPRLASNTPSALLDWNNNYGSDPNKAVCFHCSNLPKHFFRSVKMDFQERRTTARQRSQPM